MKAVNNINSSTAQAQQAFQAKFSQELTDVSFSDILMSMITVTPVQPQQQDSMAGEAPAPFEPELKETETDGSLQPVHDEAHTLAVADKVQTKSAPASDADVSEKPFQPMEPHQGNDTSAVKQEFRQDVQQAVKDVPAEYAVSQELSGQETVPDIETADYTVANPEVEQAQPEDAVPAIPVADNTVDTPEALQVSEAAQEYTPLTKGKSSVTPAEQVKIASDAQVSADVPEAELAQEAAAQANDAAEAAKTKMEKQSVQQDVPEQSGKFWNASAQLQDASSSVAKQPVSVTPGVNSKADSVPVQAELSAVSYGSYESAYVQTVVAPSPVAEAVNNAVNADTVQKAFVQPSDLRSAADAGKTQQAQVFAKMPKTAFVSRPDQSEMIERIANATKASFRNGVGRIKLLLHPQQLGTLKINIAVKDNSLSATMVTENHAARHAILNNLDALRQNLENQGINISHFEVSVDQGWQSPEQQFEDNRSNSFAPYSEKLNQDEFEPGRTTTGSSRVSNQLVDVLV